MERPIPGLSGHLSREQVTLAPATQIQKDTNLPLSIVGVENGLPVLPISNIALHMVEVPVPEAIICFANFFIKSFREKGCRPTLTARVGGILIFFFHYLFLQNRLFVEHSPVFHKLESIVQSL